jgi:hypothetical protein
MVLLVTADVGLGVVADELRRGDARLARGSRSTTALQRGRTTARSPRPPQTWALHRPSISVRATLRLENRDILMTVLAFPPMMILLLLFLQKQSLAFAVYLFGIGTLHTGPGLKKKHM